MSESNFRLYFLSLLLLFCVSPSNSFPIDNPLVGLVACHPRQIQTFTQFKSEFDTRGCDHSDKSNGVWCDNSTGAVTKLQVSACLSGTLTPNSSVFKFHHLRHLNLSFNNFISTSLPSEIGYLNKLEVLSLSSSGFLGQVPSSFNNLSLLSYLTLSRNDLTGPFPHVRNFTKLSVLDLSKNHFSGTLNTNTGLFELHHLSFLNLDTNNFSSSLPYELGKLYRIEALSLATNDFFGQVPSTISNLTRLAKFYLNINEFTGSFPLIQNLTELSVLEIAQNGFSGTIPSSLLTKPFLSYIDLSENHFTGSLEVLNSSTSSILEELYLGKNHFEAQIIESISKLINLTALDLSFLNTSQSIDLSHFSSFKYLLYLNLSGNNINPASLSSNSYIPVTLQILNLESCGIREFPNILKTLQNLEQINLMRNGIQGKIPEWLWSLSRLVLVGVSNNLLNGFEGSNEVLVNSSVLVLFMEFNNFEGPLPSLPLSINAIFARRNNFIGEVPLSICNRSSLAILDLAYNNFTGPIPQCVSNFTFVDFRNNSLEGSIPDTFCVGASLQALDVGFNRITGKLPRSFLNCSSLKFLSVDNNNIEDTFPFSLKALPNLQVMILRSNKFHGPISTSQEGHDGFPKLRIFEIADNKFNGSLSPSYFVNWRASSTMTNEDGGLYMTYGKIFYGIECFYVYHIDLQYKGLHMEQEQVFNLYSAIDFSRNQFEGNIPESIGLLKGLVALNLSNNAFTGHIPLSLANLQELESLDMSRNHLSGTIPNGLGSLSFLAFINVSYNQLHGEIPQGTQITGQPKSSFEGNGGLCGLPLDKNCFETSTPQTHHRKKEDEEEEDEQEEEDEVLNWKGVAMGYGFGVLFGLAIGQVIVSYKPEWLAKTIGIAKGRNH